MLHGPRDEEPNTLRTDSSRLRPGELTLSAHRLEGGNCRASNGTSRGGTPTAQWAPEVTSPLPIAATQTVLTHRGSSHRRDKTESNLFPELVAWPVKPRPPPPTAQQQQGITRSRPPSPADSIVDAPERLPKFQPTGSGPRCTPFHPSLRRSDAASEPNSRDAKRLPPKPEKSVFGDEITKSGNRRSAGPPP